MAQLKQLVILRQDLPPQNFTHEVRGTASEIAPYLRAAHAGVHARPARVLFATGWRDCTCALTIRSAKLGEAVVSLEISPLLGRVPADVWSRAE